MVLLSHLAYWWYAVPLQSKCRLAQSSRGLTNNRFRIWNAKGCTERLCAHSEHDTVNLALGMDRARDTFSAEWLPGPGMGRLLRASYRLASECMCHVQR